MLNKRNADKLAAMSKDEKDKLENDKSEGEVWDNDPRYVFMT